MSIPDYQTVMLPLLQSLADGQFHVIRDVAENLAAKFGLIDDERRQLLPSGQQTVFHNRVGWAKTHMKMAGLIENPSRGAVKISSLGRQVLDQHPSRIDVAFLRQFPSFVEFTKKSQAPEHVAGDDHPAPTTPEESLEASYKALRDALAAEILERVETCSPQFFERLVVQLLVAMGYGGSLADAGQAIGRTGDGGIDGIIKEDKLGLDIVCIQAKRWSATVGAATVREFAGSMEPHRARKGVLITTSSFSADAKHYVSQAERKIVLIDGETLAELMIDHNVGVTTTQSYVVKRVDSDFFLEEDA
jgi:restriction system protein